MLISILPIVCIIIYIIEAIFTASRKNSWLAIFTAFYGKTWPSSRNMGPNWTSKWRGGEKRGAKWGKEVEGEGEKEKGKEESKGISFVTPLSKFMATPLTTHIVQTTTAPLWYFVWQSYVRASLQLLWVTTFNMLSVGSHCITNIKHYYGPCYSHSNTFKQLDL